MKFLFDSKLAPLTNNISFIDAGIDEVLKGYKLWLDNGNKLVTDKVQIKVTEIKGDFKQCLFRLLPFAKNSTTKTIIMQTNSNWSVIIGNDWGGSNQNSIDLISKWINKRFIKINAWQFNPGQQENANGWGGGDFIYCNPQTSQYRSIGIRLELIAWEFDQYGEPLDFENTHIYKSKTVKNRLTPDVIDKYAKHYGIDFFNESFYMPKGSKAYIIESSSKYIETVDFLSLNDNRIRLGLITDNEIKVEDDKNIFDFIKSNKDFWFTFSGVGLLIYTFLSYDVFIDPSNQSFSGRSKAIKLFFMTMDKLGGKWTVISILFIAIIIYSLSTYLDFKKWKEYKK